MQKIPTLFIRDERTKLVTPEINPVCQWVADGKGVATVKHDGTACMIRNGRLYKRYEVKDGKGRPDNFEPAGEVDKNTGKQQGWLPVSSEASTDKWHREAFTNGETDDGEPLADGTYELLGPKIQGNPEAFATHMLVPHGCISMTNVPRDFDGLKKAFGDEFSPLSRIEGIVFHHSDGRMAKIKIRDFGLKRKVKT